MKMQAKQLEEDKLLNASITDFEMFANSGAFNIQNLFCTNTNYSHNDNHVG